MKLIRRYLKYPTGYRKKISIVLPDGYRPHGEGYPVLWLLDGQNQFGTRGICGGWQTDRLTAEYAAEGGPQFILVGIDNTVNRESELTMTLGELRPFAAEEFCDRTGEQFAEFLTQSLVPYIRKHFNVCWAPEDNAIIGSSCGGIAAFCLGMSNPELFGKVGALSPAFYMYDDDVWKAWLSSLPFDEEHRCPDVYIYNGMADPLEEALYDGAASMPLLMRQAGLRSHVWFAFDSEAVHNEVAWKTIMPDILRTLFPRDY